MDLLSEIEQGLEQLAQPVNEADKLIVTDLAKIDRWLKKRAGLITSSTLSDLMKKGRGKDGVWGKSALAVMYAVLYERRTKVAIENKDYVKNFKFGHENEDNAVAWLKRKGHDILTSNDFEDVIFNTPFAGFGDSPDGIDSTGVFIDEIKCPTNQAKYEELRHLTEITSKTEYYSQFIGHFIGAPKAEFLRYTIYDAYSDDGHVVIMKRADHLKAISEHATRIVTANKLINKALINNKNIEL